MRLLAVATLLAGPISSYAAEEQSAGLWHLSHLSDPTTGKFNYCAVENAFDNGLTLAFARNRDFNTNIVVSFPDKRLQEHSRYKMLVAVDSNPVRDMDAFSADQTILVVPLQRDRKLLDWLQKGKLLELKGPQDSVKFALDGANDAFHKLQACVEQGLKDEAVHTARPGQPVKDSQIATAEAAQPMLSNMVQPLPLPAAIPAPPTIASPVAATPVAAVPPPSSEAPPAATPAPVKEAPPEPPPSAAALVAETAPSASDTNVPAPQTAAVAEPSPAMQRFLDKLKTAQVPDLRAPPPQPAKKTLPEPVGPAQPQAAPIAAAAPDRPAEPPQPAVEQPPAPAPQVAVPEQPVMNKPAAAPAQVASAEPAPATVAAPPAQPRVVIKPVEHNVTATLPSMGDLLKVAGLSSVGSCGKGSTSCQWHDAGINGTIVEMASRKSIIDTMLDDADARDKACHGHFTAENAAPVIRNGIETADAIYACNDTASAVVYAHGSDRVMEVAVDATGASKAPALQARQKIVTAMETPASFR